MYYCWFWNNMMHNFISFIRFCFFSIAVLCLLSILNSIYPLIELLVYNKSCLYFKIVTCYDLNKNETSYKTMKSYTQMKNKLM
jgi:hypothetical protein